MLANLAFFLAIANSANAGWQYTKWGMKVEQVIAASKGTARRFNDTSSDPLISDEKGATGSFESGGLKFAVTFYFSKNGGGLETVDLLLLDPNSQKVDGLEAVLIGKYGTPYFDSGMIEGAIRNRKWSSPEARVSFFEEFPNVARSESYEVLYEFIPETKGFWVWSEEINAQNMTQERRAGGLL